MLLFLAALEREVSGITPLLTHRQKTLVEGHRSYVGTIAGADAGIVVSGIGQRRASLAFTAAIKAFSPSAIVNVGYCGSCDVGLAPGEVIIPGTFAHKGSASRLYPDPRLLDFALRSGNPQRLPNTGLLTMPSIALPADKVAAGNAGCAAVDMEAYWMAAEAAVTQIPFVAIKAVVDALPDQVPDLAQLQTPDGRLGLSRAVKYFSTNPTMLLAAGKLGRNAGLASRRLGIAVSSFSNLFANSLPEKHIGRPAIANR